MPALHSTPLRRGPILVACILAMFMAAIEVTIVATAMPDIIASLGGFSLLSWVFSIYLLLQAISIPIYGRLADMFSRKLIFFIGTWLFLSGSILCGFANHMTTLIFFRALQGLGAGAIVPIVTIIIADIYNQQERACLQGYLSSVWAISAITGPIIGAFIVHHYHWSGVFWVNVPLGVISSILLARYLPAFPHCHNLVSLDIAGITYMALAFSCLIVALLQGNSVGDWRILLLILSAISAVLLVQEQKRSSAPLFPLELWQNKIIIAGNIGELIIGAAMMSIVAFLPTYIQVVMGKSALEASWTLTVMSLGWPLASTMCGRLMIHTSYRQMALCGAILLIVGSLILLRLNASSSIITARIASFIIGMGMGMSNTTFLISVQNEAPISIRGIATASTVFTRMIGSALGTALLGATLNSNLRLRLPEINDPVQHLIAHQGQNGPGLTYIVQQVAASMHKVYWVSSFIALFALFAASLVPSRLRPKREN